MVCAGWCVCEWVERCGEGPTRGRGTAHTAGDAVPGVSSHLVMIQTVDNQLQCVSELSVSQSLSL